MKFKIWTLVMVVELFYGTLAQDEGENAVTVKPATATTTATVQPPTAAATVQPPTAAATVQPPTAAATVQPPTAAATVKPPTAAPTTQEIDLHNVDSKCVLADMVFVLDSSGSIGRANWRKILSFVQSIVKDMIIGPNKIQVGIVTYGNRANLRFHLNKHNSVSTMLPAIAAIPWEDRATNTSGGIRYMRQYMFNFANGDRSNAPNIGIVITDGESTRDKELTLPEAKKARDAGIYMFSLGIGNDVKQAELEGIANKPTKNFVFRVGNFDALDEIKKTLLEAACQITIDCMEGNDIAFVVDTSGSVHHDSFTEMRNFIKKIVTSIVVDSGFPRFSFMTFSNGARVHFHLKDYRTHKDYIKAIDNIKYNLGRTNTADALRQLRTNVFTQRNGDRPGNRNIAVIFTDGTSNNPTETIKQARLAKEAGIHLMVIGIGKWMNRYELLEIASDPDNYNLFIAPDFKNIHTASKTLRSAFCNEINECSSNPCRNGGTCVDRINRYTCKCAANFAGINCEKACRAPADVVVALDSSGSIGEANYQRAMNFIKYLAASLNVASSRLGVETFASGTSLKFHLQDYKDRLSLVRAISWKYSRGSTSTASALRYMTNEMFTSPKGDRAKVQNVGIIITDGKSNDRRETFKQAVNARKKGIHLMSVGINIKDVYGQKELRGISSDPDSANVLSVNSFQILGNDTKQFSDKLLDAVCNNVDECASSPCRGESKCVDKINHYQCDCPDDRTGINCERRCSGKMDIVFMLDASGSIREQRYNFVKKFLISVVHQLDVRPDKTRIGLMAFSDWPRVVSNLNTHESKEDVKQAIEDARWYQGKTNIASTMRELRKMFSENRGGRKNVPHVGILITDGQATVERERTLKDAILARLDGIHLIVTSPMAKAKSLEATGIASYPEDLNVFIVKKFQDLPNIRNSLVQAVCDDEDECKSNPCANGGRCINGLKSYICLCKDQWTGNNCERKCTARRDVVFALDMSGSNETTARWMHKLAKALISGLNFNGGRTRVGVLTFDRYSRVQFHLNKYNSYLEIKNAISFLLRKGTTNIADAISTGRTMFRAANGDRAGDKNYFILMTDGHSYANKQRSKSEAERLRSEDVVMMAVGVGDYVNRNEINEIASDPDSEHAYFLKDASKIGEVARNVLDYICS